MGDTEMVAMLESKAICFSTQPNVPPSSAAELLAPTPPLDGQAEKLVDASFIDPSRF